MAETRELLKMISDDMESDMEKFDGQPFTGLAVGTQFGNQAAAIIGLAMVNSKLLDRIEELEKSNGK